MFDFVLWVVLPMLSPRGMQPTHCSQEQGERWALLRAVAVGARQKEMGGTSRLWLQAIPLFPFIDPSKNYI